MGRVLSCPSAVAVSLAAALMAAATGGASAQGAGFGPASTGPGGGGGGVGPPGGALGMGAAARSGPGARIPQGIGGTISGRMTLIGPSPTQDSPAGLALPAPPPAPMFAPQRLDTLDPAAFNQLKLPNLAPGAVARPTSPQPGIGAPKDLAPKTVALPSAVAPIQIPMVKQRLNLSASFDERGAQIRSGVKWRLFTDQSNGDGEHMLVAESTDPSPHFDVDPGAYIVHAVYGLVSAAKFVTVKAAQPNAQTLVLAAGAVRLAAFVGGGKAPDDAVTFKLTRDDGGVARTVADGVKPGELIRLPAGSYHVVSSYGDANASVEADLQVASGKLVEAQVHHKAARVTLKLLQQPGGPELRDTSWTILTPGGDVIRDSIGALTGIVLAEGDYTAIARRDGRLYQQSFAVKSGVEGKVEVAAD